VTPSLLDVHADAELQICYPAIFSCRLDVASQPPNTAETAHDKEAASVRKVLNHLRPALAEAPKRNAGAPDWWKAVIAARRTNSARDSAVKSGAFRQFPQVFRSSAA
jgi:hypothetical protein